jgi:hypothetical protein
MFCAPELVFGGTEGVRSRLHVLHARTHFLRYRQVPFNFLCARHFFDGTEGAVSRFHVLRSRTHVRRYQGVGYCFHVLRARTIFQRYGRRRVPFSCFARPEFFRRYRWRRVPFSCFALPDMFSAISRASGPVFMFCAPGLVFGGTEGVVCRLHVLHARTHFRRYRGRQVPFSCFTLPDSFSTVPRALGPVNMFCAP